MIAKQVSDVFPASVDDLPLTDAARRGLIAPLRCLRVPPAAAISAVPIVGGDFEERALAALDHQALNQAAASLYRGALRLDARDRLRRRRRPRVQPGAGFRAAGLKARPSPAARRRSSAETLAAYERGDLNVLINAMLLAGGWNSPRATVVMHLAPTASKRVYQQRIGRIMRTHPRKEAGIVVDFTPKSATHNERVVSPTRCSTPTSTVRAPASRRPRAAASSAAHAAASRRRRGSSRSPRTSPAGSP